MGKAIVQEYAEYCIGKLSSDMDNDIRMEIIEEINRAVKLMLLGWITTKEAMNAISDCRR